MSFGVEGWFARGLNLKAFRDAVAGNSVLGSCFGFKRYFHCLGLWSLMDRRSLLIGTGLMASFYLIFVEKSAN